MQNTGLDEAQAGVKTARRKINNLRYAGDTTLMVENEEELKSLLMKVRGERKKLALSSKFKKKKKMEIMASSSITACQIDGGNSGNSKRLYFLGLQNHCRC